MNFSLLFKPQITFDVGTSPHGIRLGDLNQDEYLDMVLVNSFYGTVSVFLGYGNGSFTTQKTFNVGRSPYGIALGDLNRDQRLDIVVTGTGISGSTGTISVLIGDGNGSFALQKTFNVETNSLDYSWEIALGDLNQDQHLDIVVANRAISTASVFIGYGNGSFAPQQTFNVGSYSCGIVLGDLNQDQHLDIVVAKYYYSNTISVLIGNGNGGFALQQTFNVGPIGPNFCEIALGDLNQDQYLDIVVANYLDSGIIFVLISDGNGGFEPQKTFQAGPYPRGVTLGDLNQDQYLDIVVANDDSYTVSVFIGDGKGNFTPQTIFNVGFYPWGVALGDLNQDQRLDIVVTNSGSGTVSVLLGDPDTYTPSSTSALTPSDKMNFSLLFKPQITFVGNNPREIALGDLNQDGMLDIVETSYGYGNTVSVLLGYGNGSFANPITFSVGYYARKIALGDLNQDQRLDIVVANEEYSCTVSILIGHGNGSFATHTTFPVGPVAQGPWGIALGDLNQDQRLDIVVTVCCYGIDLIFSVFIGYGNGNGSFALQQTFVGSYPVGIALGDLNQDLFLDMVVVGNNKNWDSTVSVLIGDRNGGFVPQTPFKVGFRPWGIALGDLNQDGSLDMVVTNWGSSTASVFIGYGNGSFAPKKTFNVGYYARKIALGDINQDGSLDIVVANYMDSGTISVLIGDGTGSFAQRMIFNIGRYPSEIVLGDLNQDQRLDMIVTYDNTISVLLGNPDAYTSFPTSTLTPSLTLTPSDSSTTTPSPTDSHSSTASPTGSGTSTASNTQTVPPIKTNSPTASITMTATPSPSLTDSAPKTHTSTRTDSVKVLFSQTNTHSTTASNTGTQTQSKTTTLSGMSVLNKKVTSTASHTSTRSDPHLIKTCTIDLTNSTVKPKSSDSCQREIYYANNQVNTTFNITPSVTYVEINYFNVTHHALYFINFGCMRYEDLSFVLAQANLGVIAPIKNGSNITGSTTIVLNNVRYGDTSGNNFKFQDCPDAQPVSGGDDFNKPVVIGLAIGLGSFLLACIATIVGIATCYYQRRQLQLQQGQDRDAHRRGHDYQGGEEDIGPDYYDILFDTPLSTPIIGIPLFTLQEEPLRRERILEQEEAEFQRIMDREEYMRFHQMAHERVHHQLEQLEQITMQTRPVQPQHPHRVPTALPLTRTVDQQDQATSPLTPARLVQPIGETDSTGLNQPTMEYAQELEAPVMPPPFAIPRQPELADQVRPDGIAATHQDPVQTTVPAHRGVQAQPIQPEEVRPVPFELPLTRPHWPQTEERHALNQAVLVPEPPVTREALLAYQESVPEEQDGTYFMDDTTQGTVPAEAEWLN